MKRSICLLLCLVLTLGLLPLPVGAVTTVSNISFNLEYPQAGKTPPGTATWLSQGYCVHSIDWYDRTEDRYLESGEKIVADHQYEAILWVEALDGYQFATRDDLTPNVTATVNGETCQVSKAYEYKAWAMVCVSYYFSPVPAKGWIRSVDLTVPAPVAGQKPSYTQLTGIDYYSGNVYFNDKTNENMRNGIAWYPSGQDYLKPDTAVFGENTVYMFHCLLFPEEGYRFIPTAKVYVNGELAEASLDYDTFLAVGYQFPATGTAFHTHFYTQWQYNSGQHYKNCTDCDDVFFVESHKGGTATCTQKGVCTVCGYAYLEMTDHRWSPTYLYQDSKGHAWVCADCKEHSDVKPHTPGPAATETEPQKCLDCGYILEPEKNHVHQLTLLPGVAATCLASGTLQHYACSGCTACFSDPEGKNRIAEDVELFPAPLGHSVGDNWGMDGEFHWRTCSRCSEMLDETKMVHEGQPCATCGYPQSGQTEPAKQEGDGFKLGGGWLVILPVILIPVAAAVCFVAAVVITVIVVKKKRGKAK